MNKTIINSTPFGSVVVLWSTINGEPRVIRVVLSQPGFSAERRALELFPAANAATCPAIAALCTEIVASLNGQKIRFSLDQVQLALCPAFQQRVLRVEHKIPFGSVSTYQMLAAHLDQPAAARAVGNALANNPFPIIVPCHRTIRSDRTLGGYQGGLAMKRALLEREGLRFDAQWRVLTEQLRFDRLTAVGTELAPS